MLEGGCCLTSASFCCLEWAKADTSFPDGWLFVIEKSASAEGHLQVRKLHSMGFVAALEMPMTHSHPTGAAGEEAQGDCAGGSGRR